MASTYTPAQALDFVKQLVKKMPLEQIQVRVLDDVQKMMWMHSPWRWTIGALPNVTLASNTQDYSIALPADFLYAEQAYINDQAGGMPRPLRIIAPIPAGGIIGSPSQVSITGAANTTGNARFFPSVQAVPTPAWIMTSVYKKISPVLIASNLNTSGVLVFDDEWFPVYESGVLWQAYLYGDDQRAGGAQIDPVSGKITYTGQRGIFEANLLAMRSREKLAIMDTRDAADPTLGT